MASFPDQRWGSENSRLRRPLIGFSCTKVGSWTIRKLTPTDRWLLRRSHGRFTVLGPFGIPVMLLTTTGAKSGMPRTTPLLYARDEDAIIVTGSNFGQHHHPAWSGNLIAHPQAIVTIGGDEVPARATLLAGPEAESAWQKMVEVARTYTEYRSRTARDIRVFRLTALQPSD